jgi:membrane protease YdiL (CAAX protease family)
MRTTYHPIATDIGLGFFAIVVTLVTGGIWTGLLATNLAVSPAIPWAVIIMGLILWLLWRFLGGALGLQHSAAIRRASLRATRLPAPLFLWSVTTGLLGIVALAGLWIVLFQFANLSTTRFLPNYAHYPTTTVGLALIMASLVGGVIEEATFRGYFQGALERQMSAPLAILIVVLVMAPEHALTQGFVWPTFVFYGCVDVMLCTLAYLTHSILPGIVVHCVGLLAFFTLVWPGDIVHQLIGGGNATTWIWIHALQFLVFGILTLAAFWRLKTQLRSRS